MSQLLSQYGANIAAAVAGLLADMNPQKVDSMANGSKLKQVQTVTIAGTLAEDDTFTLGITLPSNLPVSDFAVSVTATADATPTATEIAAALVAAVKAASEWADFQKYMTVTSALGVITITSLFDGLDIELSVSKVSTQGTIVAAETTAPSRGAALDFGVGVDRVAAGECQVHQSGGTCIGVAIREHGSAINRGGTGASEYEAQSICSILRNGVIWVPVNGAVTAGAAAYCVHTGTGVIGHFRADNTNADAVTGAVFESAAAAGGLAKLRINQ